MFSFTVLISVAREYGKVERSEDDPWTVTSREERSTVGFEIIYFEVAVTVICSVLSTPSNTFTVVEYRLAVPFEKAEMAKSVSV